MNRSDPSAAAEDYLKAILEIQNRRDSDLASMGDVSTALDLTPGTVTTMVRRLADDGLLDYRPRKGCRLTPAGRRAALRILRRHRVLETYLVMNLGLDWAEVHGEAERMEHGASDRVIDRMWESLGRPGRDPHGGAIPDENLMMPDDDGDVPLSSLGDGKSGVLTRFPDRDPDLLQALRGAGLRPGARFSVIRREGTGTLELHGPEGILNLSAAVAGTLRATPQEEKEPRTSPR